MSAAPLTLDETDDIPVTVAPADLPKGERILWQGRPDWWRLTLNTFRLKLVTLYFAALILWRIGSTHHDTGDLSLAVGLSMPLVLAYCVTAAILIVMAVLYARTTGFTVTDKRVVLRFGVALPSQLNIPLKDVEAAGLRLYRDGSGDIPLTLPEKNRPFYFQIWPFARPWKLRAAEPMLRGVPEAEAVANVLAGALATTGGKAQAAAAEARSGRETKSPAAGREAALA